VRLALLLLVVGCTDDPVVVVRTPEGDVRARYHVEVARTAAARMQGLRGIDGLAKDDGLWIEFPVDDEVCIVNSGVSFAIDAVFVRSERVVAVETFEPEEAEPRCFIGSEVLEVSAGSPIQVGDSATH